MPLPDYIASREDWDKHQEEQLRARHCGDPQGFERAKQRCYPISLAAAVVELRERGLRVTDDDLPLYCDLPSLQRIGRNYVLYPTDVDRVAEILADRGRISGLALRRKNAEISYAEEMEGIRHIHNLRRQRIANELSVSITELNAAIRMGAIHDPAYRTINIEEARDWFSQNRQSRLFLNEVRFLEAA